MFDIALAFKEIHHGDRKYIIFTVYCASVVGCIQSCEKRIDLAGRFRIDTLENIIGELFTCGSQ